MQRLVRWAEPSIQLGKDVIKASEVRTLMENNDELKKFLDEKKFKRTKRGANAPADYANYGICGTLTGKKEGTRYFVVELFQYSEVKQGVVQTGKTHSILVAKEIKFTEINGEIKAELLPPFFDVRDDLSASDLMDGQQITISGQEMTLVHDKLSSPLDLLNIKVR